MKRAISRAAGPAALMFALALALTGCGGFGSSAEPSSASTPPPARTSVTPTAASSPGNEPASCGKGVRIPAVDIPAVHADPVKVPAATIGGETVPGFTVPGVDIPAQRIPAQCTTEAPAPGGCLGTVGIPPVRIPGVRLPAVEIPGVDAGGVRHGPVRREAVIRQPVVREGVTRQEVCQRTSAGGEVFAVERLALERLALERLALERVAVSRPRLCNSDRECVPPVDVPAVTVPAVQVPAVQIPAAVLKARKMGDAEAFEGDDEVAYDLKADVLFDFGKAEVKPAAVRTLKRIAARIRAENAGARVRVDGHTDAKGTDSSNLELSKRRAAAVVDWLATEGGIERSLLSAAGYGEAKPVMPNTKDGRDFPEGRAANRRVVISASTA